MSVESDGEARSQVLKPERTTHEEIMRRELTRTALGLEWHETRPTLKGYLSALGLGLLGAFSVGALCWFFVPVFVGVLCIVLLMVSPTLLRSPWFLMFAITMAAGVSNLLLSFSSRRRFQRARLLHRILQFVPPQTPIVRRQISRDEHELVFEFAEGPEMRLSFFPKGWLRRFTLQCGDEALQTASDVERLDAFLRRHAPPLQRMAEAVSGQGSALEPLSAGQGGHQEAPSPWSRRLEVTLGTRVPSALVSHEPWWFLNGLWGLRPLLFMFALGATWALLSYSPLWGHALQRASWGSVLLMIVVGALGAMEGGVRYVRHMVRGVGALTEPIPNPVRHLARLDFDGRWLELVSTSEGSAAPVAARVDLHQPFVINVSREGAEASLVCLTLVQGQVSLRVQVQLSEALMSPQWPVLTTDAPYVSGQVFQDELGPTLNYYAQLHGVENPLTDRQVRVSREAVVGSAAL